jgi:hypothetical protein
MASGGQWSGLNPIHNQIEDDDLYAFVEESAAQLAVPLVRVADGRTPWQVFEDKQLLGNSLLAPCSYVLKILPCRRWLRDHTDPARTMLYVGIDNSARDRRRAPAIERGWLPWRVAFPLLDEPDLSKADMLAEARGLGLRPPRAYELGFDHANFYWTTEDREHDETTAVVRRVSNRTNREAR